MASMKVPRPANNWISGGEIPNEFAFLSPTQTPKSESKHTMPIQNKIQKQFHTHRDRAKSSRLECALITMALGGRKLARVFLPAIAVTAIVLSAIPAPAAEPKVKIGIALAMFDDVFITNVRDAMTKWAQTHSDADLAIVDANNDTAKQMGQVENFLAQGKDAIVILPVDTTATGPMTKASSKPASPWCMSTASHRTCLRAPCTWGPSPVTPGS
jgi:Periplasmic binding protein domain